MTAAMTLKFEVPSIGEAVSAILQRPDEPVGLFVLGHGSGSNMYVPLMVGLADALADHGVATLRFEYPYSDKPEFVPNSDMPQDADDVLIATVRAALACAATEAPELPLFVGGHSVSAQMASKADANDPLAAEAIISMGFPRKGDPANTAHLDSTTLPMLLIQGTKDILGSEAEIADMAGTLGDRATVRWVQGASHGFNVEGRQDGEVIGEVANHINDYIRQQ